MLVQAEEEEQEEKSAPDPDFQDEDYFEDQVAAADFDDTLPVGGLMVSGSVWAWARRGSCIANLRIILLGPIHNCSLRACILAASERDIRRGRL